MPLGVSSKEKDYELVRGPDYRATEKADRSAHFECTRCFNGSLGKRRKIAGECFNEVSRSTFIRFIFSDAITRCCILRDEGNLLLSVRAETFTSMLLALLHGVDPKGLSCNMRSLKGDICAQISCSDFITSG